MALISNPVALDQLICRTLYLDGARIRDMHWRSLPQYRVSTNLLVQEWTSGPEGVISKASRNIAKGELILAEVPILVVWHKLWSNGGEDHVIDILANAGG